MDYYSTQCPNISCGAQPIPIPAQACGSQAAVSPMTNQQPYPGVSPRPGCYGQTRGPVEQKMIAMAYVPWQQWNQPYSIDKGLFRGTIFPELDLPFTRGRC